MSSNSPHGGQRAKPLARLRQAGAEETSQCITERSARFRVMPACAGTAAARFLCPRPRPMADGVPFLARLGSEVSDILDEFLTFALDHERSGLPGPAGFHLDAGDRSAHGQARTGQGNATSSRYDRTCRQGPRGAGSSSWLTAAVRPSSASRSRTFASWRKRRPIIPGSRSGLARAGFCAELAHRRRQRAAEEARRGRNTAGPLCRMTRAADRPDRLGYRGQRQNTDTWHSMVQGTLATGPEGPPERQGFSAPEARSGRALPGREAHVPRDLPTSEGGSEESQRPTAGLRRRFSRLRPRRGGCPGLLPRPARPSQSTTRRRSDASARPFSPGRARRNSRCSAARSCTGCCRFFRRSAAASAWPRRSAISPVPCRAGPKPNGAHLPGTSWTCSTMRICNRFSASTGGRKSPSWGAEARDPRIRRIGPYRPSGRHRRHGDHRRLQDNREIPESPEEIAPVYRNQARDLSGNPNLFTPGKRFRCVLIFTEGPAIRVLPEPMLDRSLEELATK